MLTDYHMEHKNFITRYLFPMFNNFMSLWAMKSTFRFSYISLAIYLLKQFIFVK